jgi:hypothetical protein
MQQQRRGITSIQHGNGGDLRRFVARIAGCSGSPLSTIALSDAPDDLP